MIRRALVLWALAATAAAAAAQGPAPEGSAPQATRPEARALFLFNQSLYFGSFSRPRALAYDREHHELWVGDAGARRIGIHRPDGTELYSFASSERLQDPVRLAVAPGGGIAVVDGSRAHVRLFDYRGDDRGDVTLAELGEHPVIGAIAYDRRGQLYVADNRTGQIFVYQAGGTLKFQFGSQGSDDGQFLAICGIAIGPDGKIYVADQRALAAQVFDEQGNFLRGWGKHEMGAQNFSLPSGIAVDSHGRIIITDELRHQVKVFSGDGKLLTVFGGMGDELGQLAYPSDVAVDENDRIYVAERITARVQVFELNAVAAQ
jgi:DNA-binding beta-propeller fold protein YncE